MREASPPGETGMLVVDSVVRLFTFGGNIIQFCKTLIIVKIYLHLLSI